MRKRFKRGLFLGKFMPLHQGHERILREALIDCEEVTVIVYDCQVEGEHWPMPVQLRVNWIKELYPRVKTIVVLPCLGEDTGEAYAEQISFLGHFDAYYAAEPEYKDFANKVADNFILFNKDGRGISGSLIRSDPYKYRHMMDSEVYSSLVRKVVFVGTESTGKSTLASRMATEMGTEWVHEYGRELWEQQNWQGSFEDLMKIAIAQTDRERYFRRYCNKYLFCDTNAFTTLMWSLYKHDVADERLWSLVEQTKNDYIWILCDNDFGWIQDGTREFEGNKSIEFQHLNIKYLRWFGINFYQVTGSIEYRIKQVKSLLEWEDKING